MALIPGRRAVHVTRAFLPPFEEFVEALRPIWETAALANHGPFHDQLARRLREFLGVERLVLFVNGHQALENGLQALGLNGEVITTPFTFPSTSHAIVRSGLTPVFCDIRPDNGNIDESRIEALVTERTSAILPVHVYGNPCDEAAIGSIAARHGLKVIYDAAHAFGVVTQTGGIGTWGDLSMFSFHATKVFNTVEGGALTFRDADLERDLVLRRNFGIAGPDDVRMVGTNAKMNEIQALMGLLNLEYVAGEIAAREAKIAAYRTLLAAVPGIRWLGGAPGVKSNHAYVPLLIEESAYGATRDELFQTLAAAGIHARKYFHPLVPNYACYRGRFTADLPVASYIADRVITLPLWGAIPDETVERTCRIVSETHHRRGAGG
jgi:dTDP-4-amino-4,6-dideoxygalactose transaminase